MNTKIRTPMCASITSPSAAAAASSSLQTGTVDFGASDAPLSDAEVKTMPESGRASSHVAGAVAVTYNLPGVERA